MDHFAALKTEPNTRISSAEYLYIKSAMRFQLELAFSLILISNSATTEGLFLLDLFLLPKSVSNYGRKLLFSYCYQSHE